MAAVQNMAEPLSGKIAFVTGGARGIGRATALEFARNGADVLIADVNDVAAKETLDELHGLGTRAWAAHLDVSDAHIEEASEAIPRALGVLARA